MIRNEVFQILFAFYKFRHLPIFFIGQFISPIFKKKKKYVNQKKFGHQKMIAIS